MFVSSVFIFTVMGPFDHCWTWELWFLFSNLPSWLQAKPLLSSGEIKQLVDPFLGNDYDCDEMERMTLAASLCTRTSSHSRPDMSLVRTWWFTWKEEHLQFHQKQHRSLHKSDFEMLIMRPRSWNCSKGTTKQSLGHGRRSPPASTVRMRRSQPLSRTCSRIWALRCSGWRRTTRSRAAAAPWTPRPTATGAGRRASTSTLRNLRRGGDWSELCVQIPCVWECDWRDDCVRAVENRCPFISWEMWW